LYQQKKIQVQASPSALYSLPIVVLFQTTAKTTIRTTS